MPEAVFVLAPSQNQFFFELAAAIGYELERCGIKVSVSTDGFPAPRPGLAYLLLPPHEYYVLEGYAAPPDPATFRRTILICCEQPSTPHFTQNVSFAGGAAAVFDINRRSVREFARAGIRAEHLRIGYTPYWDRHGAASGDRPVDIAFMGAYSLRRAQVIGGYANILQQYRCELHFSDNSSPNHKGARSFLAGEHKWNLLLRAKTLLNVHQGAEPYFEWLRVIEALHAGCVVISESSTDFSPLVAGEHLLIGQAENLGLLAEELLESPDVLARIRSAAYQFLREELPMSDGVERLAGAIEQAGQLPAKGRGTQPKHVLAPEMLPTFDNESRPPAGDHNVSALRRALKEMRLQVLDIRRELARLSERAGSGHSLAPRIDFSTAAYAGLERPQVSVLTPLYNHAQHIAPALDSVLAGHFPSVELIVVNDGSTDDSREAAVRWMQHHSEVPGIVISHAINRGLPHARNTALDFARGDWTLIFDADNLLLPHCLHRLSAVLLDDPGAAFAYGILSGFDSGGPRHMLSQFQWEPRRLRRDNYIDALALLRTAVLRSAGGFCADPRLYGVEDWDLWATLVDHGHRGVLVPEILARYRVSATSMLSITDLSPTGRYGAMIERHPELMHGIEVPL